MSEITLTAEEWKKKGEELFGAETKNWCFICPSCGHVQKVSDFKQYKEQGADPNDAFFNCIGRFSGEGREAFEIFEDGRGKKKKKKVKRPCNYTGGGLIRLNPIKVIMSEGETTVFDFAVNGKPYFTNQIKKESGSRV